MSMHQTSLPSSAKPAAVTRPTYPVPMTPMGSLSVCWLISEPNRLAASRYCLSLVSEPAMASICRVLSDCDSVLETQ